METRVLHSARSTHAPAHSSAKLSAIGGQSVKRVFTPSWGLTAAAIALCAICIRLGLWQWHKGQLREQEWESFSRGAGQVIPLGSRGVSDVARFQQVTVTGRFDVTRQFLLDNRTHDGRAGYEVLTPLERPDGRLLLVDRGWVPFSGLRQQLPNVTLETSGPIELTGRVDDLPAGGLESGRSAPSQGGGWPKVTSYPTMQQLSTALARQLEPRILLLDAKAPYGYVRDWHPPGMQPLRHWSYAIQWWCFAALVGVFWGVFSLRKAS